MIEWWGDLSKSGIIATNGEQFTFSEIDVVKGVPEIGHSARFRTVPGSELPRAVEVKIE